MTALTPVRQQLEQALDEIKKECIALESQLSLKRKRMEALEFLLVGERAEEMVPYAEKEEDDIENATAKVREIIKNAGSMGVRPRDITRKLREQGIKVSTQFASNAVWRLKNKTKEIEKVGSRYRWKREGINLFSPAQKG